MRGEQLAERVAEIEAKIGRALYREERRAVQQGLHILPQAKQVSDSEAKLGRRLHRDEVQAILRGEHILPSAVEGETWMAHPEQVIRGRGRIVPGGAIESNRRRH